MNIINNVVNNKWCIGCGMCAAICPRARLAISWNERGEYNPKEVEENCAKCNENCSLCYQVCPAHGQTKNETEVGTDLYGNILGVHFRKETGYYLDSFVGYSNDHRATSASGGMASWTLEALLSSGEVDAVAAVGRTSNPDKLFEFKMCQSVEEIRDCGRSAYYPVEISQVIQYILHNEGRYAIIGLPCVCKSIRLAQDKLPKLKRRITHVLGLTCGHQCSKFFAEYICALGGGDPHDLREIIFRTKDLSQPASNHGITFRSGEGDTLVHKQVLWKDGVGLAYTSGYFQLPGCFYCDDVFAECADMTFMDAWLPDYVKDPEGTSLVVVRGKQINAMLQKAISDDTISCHTLPIDKIIQSQRGVVHRKRVRKTEKGNTPQLREDILKRPLFFMPNMSMLHKEIARKTSASWKIDKNHKRMFNHIRMLERKIIFFSNIKNFFRVPYKILKKFILVSK